MKTNNIYPPATERTLQILEYMLEYPLPISIKELSDNLSIPHSSVFRIVKCLADHGYLRMPANNSEKYVLGYKMQLFSKAGSESDLLEQVTSPHMKLLADKTHQACQLCVMLEDGKVMTINQCLPADTTITVIAKLGEKYSMNISAGGKILFAHLPDVRKRKLIEFAKSSFQQNTPHTTCDCDELLNELDASLQRGYGSDIEEYALGIGCLAVPLFDHTERPVAALNLTGPVDYYKNKESMQVILNLLMETGYKISRELGCSGALSCYRFKEDGE